MPSRDRASRSRFSHCISGWARAIALFKMCRFARGGHRGKAWGTGVPRGSWLRKSRAAPPLPRARPPHRHQHGLRPRTGPGAAATPELAKDGAEADGQLGPPVGGAQPRLTQEREQVVAMRPQVLGQTLVGRVGLQGKPGSIIPGWAVAPVPLRTRISLSCGRYSNTGGPAHCRSVASSSPTAGALVNRSSLLL
jgi:hypothetical protein